MIIDAWAQHVTLRHAQDPMVESLRRWTKAPLPTAVPPVSTTLAMMDAAGIERSLISAWVAPRNVMISNDEVASFVVESKGRLVGVGSVDISKPMAAMREVRRCVQELGFNPMIQPAKALEGLETLGLDDETHALFLGGNAARVYGLQ